MNRAIIVLAAVLGAAAGVGPPAGADEIPAQPAAQAQYFPKAQVIALAKPIEGMAAKEILSYPGSTTFVVLRDRDGQVEVHLAQNDIIVVISGHGRMSVGGEVKGDRETEPAEWRGGVISGGTDYPLSAGDVLFVPAGTPHKALVAPHATLTYLIVKTPK